MSCGSASAGTRTALVELYVSDDCGRCPEAERWLASLAARHDAPGGVLAVLLDTRANGSPPKDDVLARRERARRDYRRARLGRPRPLLVPLVLVQGRERGDWGRASFEHALKGLYGGPARALLRLEIEPRQPIGARADFRVRIEVELDPSERSKNVALYVAATGTPIGPGQGAGRLSYQVKEWLGPIPVGPGGRLSESRVLPLPPQAEASVVGAVAFVQNRSSREVLQSLVRPPCNE